MRHFLDWWSFFSQFYSADSAIVWVKCDTAMSNHCQGVSSMNKPWDVHYCTALSSQFIQSRCCQLCCRCHVSWSHIWTVLSTTLHAEKSKMYCRKSSTFPLIISDIHTQILSNCFEVFSFQVTIFMLIFRLLRIKSEELESRTHESISDLVWSTWSICSSAIHWVTAWRSAQLEVFPVIFSAVLYKHFLWEMSRKDIMAYQVSS